MDRTQAQSTGNLGGRAPTSSTLGQRLERHPSRSDAGRRGSPTAWRAGVDRALAEREAGPRPDRAADDHARSDHADPAAGDLGPVAAGALLRVLSVLFTDLPRAAVAGVERCALPVHQTARVRIRLRGASVPERLRRVLIGCGWLFTGRPGGARPTGGRDDRSP